MFKELLKAKRNYYGKMGWYPEAIKISKKAYTELSREAKILSLNANHGWSTRSVNGMILFIDEDQKDDFIFGFHSDNNFSEQPF